MPTGEQLGEFDQLVTLALFQLGEDTHGMGHGESTR